MTKEQAINKGEGIVYGFEEATIDEIRELICFISEEYRDGIEETDEKDLLWILAGICGVDELDLDMDYYLD